MEVLMPLVKMKTGESAILKEINWGEKMKQKLQSMGLIPGTLVSIISAGNKGPIVIDVRGSRLALGRGIVSQIEVDPV